MPATGELPDIAVGSDGGVWFTDTGANRIARLSADGATLTGHVIPSEAAWPYGITAGPDANLWFTMRDANKIGVITTSGEITELCIPTAASGPTSISVGPDGNIWFTETASGKIGRVTLPILALAPETETEAEPAVSSAPAAEDSGCSVGSRRATTSSMLGVILGLGLLAGVRRRALTRTRN